MLDQTTEIGSLDLDSVEVYISPWVSGTRAVVFYGTISSTVFVEERESVPEVWDKAIAAALRIIKEKAALMGANAITGFEVIVDPFAVEGTGCGLSVYMQGTATKLELLL